MEKLDIAIELFAKKYGLKIETAEDIVFDYDLLDMIYYDYDQEITQILKDYEEQQHEDAKNYNDGWSDHVGV